MTGVGSFGAKRKHSSTSTATQAVIEITSSSDEEDITILPPPTKRIRSITPIDQNQLSRGQSRDVKHERSFVERPSTPDQSRQISKNEFKVKSPFKKLSTYSYPDGQFNRRRTISNDQTKTSLSAVTRSTTPRSIGAEPRNGERQLLWKFQAARAGTEQSQQRSSSPRIAVDGASSGQANTASHLSRASQTAHTSPRVPLSSQTSTSIEIRSRQSPSLQPTLSRHNSQSASSLSSLQGPSTQPDKSRAARPKYRSPDRSQKPPLRAPKPDPKYRLESEQLTIKHRKSPSPPPYKSEPPTPSQANIEVIIPNLIKQWTEPLPKSAARRKADRDIERRALLNDLKVSAEHAKERPEEVLHLFGQTGFSESFSTEEDVAERRSLGSKKRKQKSSTDLTRQQLRMDTSLLESFSALTITDRQKLLPDQSAKALLTNRFNEKITPPLTFANDVNERRLPGKFQFTDRYIIRPGVKAAPPSTNFGCNCLINCEISTCSCFRKEITNEAGKVTHNEQRRTYVRRPDGIVVLTDDYIAQELNPEVKHYEITECNEFCQCRSDCMNHVVGKGRTVPLEIFQTEKCGFGVRSSVDIVKGQFIELYLGEVITEFELLRREDIAEEGESSYIYSLDWFTVDNRTGYHVDGQYYGSAMRFVNHSCNPNTRCFTVQTHKSDKKVYYLAFFAIKTIPKGVEIRIDYSGRAGVPEDQDDTAVEGELLEDLSRCYCGEKKCKRILWNPRVQARSRRRRGE